jgi:PadR family transcriptional regulator
MRGGAAAQGNGASEVGTANLHPPTRFFWQRRYGRLSSKVMGKPERNRIELLQGTLDMLILQTLQWGPRHGHGIGQAIRTRSDHSLQIEHGSLYPALHRLERDGWLVSEWRLSEANRRAKYYRLTPAGKRQLSKKRSHWDEVVRTIARVMRPAEEA